MIDIEVLKRAGLSNDSLKDIFTAPVDEGDVPKRSKIKAAAKDRKEPTDEQMLADTSFNSIDTPLDPYTTMSTLDKMPLNPTKWQVRRWWERRLMGRIQQGLYRNAQNFNKWAAIDLAYASTPIHPMTLPLMRVAQGFISIEDCQKQIGALSSCARDQLFEKDAEGKLTGVKAPQLVEVSHNLVHSLVTRRVAAISTEIAQQYPLMEFNPFSNSQEGKLRGDVMTQLGEQMAGAYGYRHDAEASIRDASLYSQSIKFKANAWHTEQQTLPKKQTTEEVQSGASGIGQPAETEYERQIIREGVVFTLPHPSRVYYDITQPVARINYDTGPQFVGHWEVVRIGDLQDNPLYYNKQVVVFDPVLYRWFVSQYAYFAQYFPDRMVAPLPPQGNAGRMALTNDRIAQIGVNAMSRYDMSTTISYHYERVIPKDVGFGTYEDPVWIRFVVAGMKTVIYAEIVGSMPASINAYNTSDNLLVSPSFAMQVLPYQEQISNLLTQLLRIQYQGLVRIWTLNTHGMKKEDIEKVEHALQYPDYNSAKDVIISYDAALLEARGQDPNTIRTKLEQIKVETRDKVTEIFQSIIQLLSIAERLLFFSPQELGQVSPRTITASEAKMVNTTTLGIRDFHLVGIKQQLDADKRIIHDSYMAFGSDELEVPVAERYDPAVVQRAGFDIVDTGEDGLFTIRGKKLGLLYNYTYTTRNTDDLPPDAAVIQGYSQIYEIISKDPQLQQIQNPQDKVDLVNMLFDKLSGGTIKFKADPAKMKALVDAQNSQQQVQQALPIIQQALQAIQNQLQQTTQQQAQDHQSISALAQALSLLGKSVAPKPFGPGANVSTQRGQISPDIPVGVGAPAMRTIQPQQVPNQLPMGGGTPIGQPTPANPGV